jgi:hypothetical protein
MSWGAQNLPKDAKTPSAGRGRSENPELDLWPVQPYIPVGGSQRANSKGPRNDLWELSK